MRKLQFEETPSTKNKVATARSVAPIPLWFLLLNNQKFLIPLLQNNHFATSERSLRWSAPSLTQRLRSYQTAHSVW